MYYFKDSNDHYMTRVLSWVMFRKFWLHLLHFLYHIKFLGVLWESQCEYVNATIPQFIKWLGKSCESDNPLGAFDSDRFWCYADYKYMAELFANHPELQEVNPTLFCTKANRIWNWIPNAPHFIFYSTSDGIWGNYESIKSNRPSSGRA